MKPVSILVVGAVLLAGWSASARAEDTKAAANDGKAVFLKYKCNSCHNVASQGIVKGGKSAAEAKPAEASAGAKKKPPDLSDVGAKHKPEFFQAYLTKKEKLNDKFHLIRFRGTDAQLAQLTGWLQSLKSEEAVKPTEAVEKAKEAAESAEESAKKSEEAADKSKEAAKKADEAADKAKEAADEAADQNKK